MSKAKQQLAKGQGSSAIAILILVALAAAVMGILTLRQLAGAEKHCLRLLAGFAERVEFRVGDLADRFAQIAGREDAEFERLSERIQHLSWVDCTKSFSQDEGAALRKLTPDVGVATAEGRLYISVRTGNPGNCEVAHGVIALDQLASPAMVSGVYDSVLIADDAGEVLFQVGDPEIRFASVKTLLGGEAPREQTQMETVEIARRKFRVFLQPISVEIPAPARSTDVGADKPPARYELTAYGIVGNDQMLSSSFMSSPTLLIFLLAIFPSCLLFWPLLKLWLISSRQRYTRFDLASLIACCVVGLALFTAAAFTLQFHLSAMRVAKDQVRDLASAVEKSLVQELGQVSEMLRVYADEYLASGSEREICLHDGGADCLEKVTSWLKQEDAGSSEAFLRQVLSPDDRETRDLFPYPYFLSVFGLTDTGRLSHVVALSPYSGGSSDIRDRAYFECARQNQGAQVGSSSLPLCVQSILSNTSGRALAAISASSEDLGLSKQDEPNLIGAALTTELRSLTRPPLPSGIQLIVVDAQGEVQFHSDPSRNLSEDLLRATDGDAELRSVLKQRRRAELALNYLGLDQLAFVQPIQGLPWSLVVLRPRADIRQKTLELQLDHLNILVLYLFALGFTLALLFGLQYVAGMQRPSTWVRYLWPQSDQVKLYDSIVLLTPIAMLAFLYVFDHRGIAPEFWVSALWPGLVAAAVVYLWWNRRSTLSSAVIVWTIAFLTLAPWWILIPGGWLGLFAIALACLVFFGLHKGILWVEKHDKFESAEWRHFERLNNLMALIVLLVAVLGTRIGAMENLGLGDSEHQGRTVSFLAFAWLLALGLWLFPEWREEQAPRQDSKPKRRLRKAYEKLEEAYEVLRRKASRTIESRFWPNLWGTLVTAGTLIYLLAEDKDALTVIFFTTLAAIVMARVRFQQYFQGGERRIAYIFALSCLLFLLGVVPVTGFLRLAAERQRQEQVQNTQLALATTLEAYARQYPSQEEALRDPLWRNQGEGESAPTHDWRTARNFRNRMGCGWSKNQDPIVESYWRAMFGTEAVNHRDVDWLEVAGPEWNGRTTVWPGPADGGAKSLSQATGSAGASTGWLPLPLSASEIVQVLARRLGTLEDPASSGIGTDLSRFRRPGTRWMWEASGDQDGSGHQTLAGLLKVDDESCQISLRSVVPTGYGARPGTIFQSLWVILGLLLLPAMAFALALILAERVLFVSLAEPGQGSKTGLGAFEKLVYRSYLHSHPFLVVTTTPELTFESLERAVPTFQDWYRRNEGSRPDEMPRIEVRRAWTQESQSTQDVLEDLRRSWENTQGEEGRLIVVASDDPRVVAARAAVPELRRGDEPAPAEAAQEARAEAADWGRFFSRFEIHHTGRSHESCIGFAEELLVLLGAPACPEIDLARLDLSHSKQRRIVLDALVDSVSKGRSLLSSPEVFRREFAETFESVFEECRATRWLQAVGRGILKEWTRPTTREEHAEWGLERILNWSAVTSALETPRRHLVSRIGRNARSYYSAIWKGCTTDEQVVLNQLARHGLANPYNFDVVSGLLQKGILVQDPAVRMMNESFATFVRSTVHRSEVVEWEEEEGTSAWTVLKWILPLPLLLIGGFLFVTQGTAWGNFVGLLVALGSIIPILNNTYSYFKTIAAKQDVST